MSFFVYVYLDPRKPGIFEYKDLIFEFEPIYIGKGKDDRMHFHKSLKGKNKYFKNKLKNIYSKNLKPIVYKIKEFIKEEESYLYEEYCIKTIGRFIKNEGPLTNINKGGIGKIGFDEIVKEKISKANKGLKWNKEQKELQSLKTSGKKNGMYGKTHTKKTKEKISKANKGRKHSEESKKKMSNAHKGHKRHTTEQISTIKEYMSNRTVSKETKEKIRLSKTGKNLSKEHRDAISKGKTGVKRGPYKKTGNKRINYKNDIEITCVETNNKYNFDSFKKLYEFFESYKPNFLDLNYNQLKYKALKNEQINNFKIVCVRSEI